MNSRPHLLYLCLFIQLPVNKGSIKVANDWICAGILCHWLALVCQLYHNHCPGLLKHTVSSHYRYWLYGDRVVPAQGDVSQNSSRVRGWFPRRCAAEMIENDGDVGLSQNKKKEAKKVK